MMYALIPILVSAGVFLGMFACIELGFRAGRSRARRNAPAREGIDMIAAAILALLGLLLAFAFAGGVSRLDQRRELAVKEAILVGDADDLLDLLPPANQQELRRMLRKYVAARVNVYHTLPDLAAAKGHIASAEQLHDEIWQQAIDAGKLDSSGHVLRLLLPALNEMRDVAAARTIAIETHLPPLIFVLLIAVALLSAVASGHAMGAQAERSLLHM